MKKMFCQPEKCEWYLKNKPNKRKCYYGDPQCWKGYIRILCYITKLSIIQMFKSLKYRKN